MIDLRCGDMREVLAALDADSIEACVTDPPYGLSFMGKGWDKQVPGVEFWDAVCRVLKPGAHLIAFAGTRTWHRMACAIEDAGFELRDTLMWVYGSGFPKSLDVSKAIDKEAGAEREAVTETVRDVFGERDEARIVTKARSSDGASALPTMGAAVEYKSWGVSAPATPAAQQWQGWGTALKPAWEPAMLFRKPFPGTVASNVLQHGTGAINVDGCRVSCEGGRPKNESKSEISLNAFGNGLNGSRGAGVTTEGRWPANLIHDGSAEVLAGFPVTNPSKASSDTSPGAASMMLANPWKRGASHDDAGGSAARFFYCAKASRSERNKGLEQQNHHPTVKPVDLMRYLCRLVTPPGGIVLDPFMGSGSTGIAAKLEGFEFIGCDLDAEYVEIARARIAGWEPETTTTPLDDYLARP